MTFIHLKTKTTNKICFCRHISLTKGGQKEKKKKEDLSDKLTYRRHINQTLLRQSASQLRSEEKEGRREQVVRRERTGQENEEKDREEMVNMAR